MVDWANLNEVDWIIIVVYLVFTFGIGLYAKRFVSGLAGYLVAGRSLKVGVCTAGMIATDVTSPFFAPFKLTLVLAIFAAIPFILHQIWSFIAPGLYSNEKKIAMPLLVSSILLFYAGIAFAFYVVFPLVFGFFTAAAPDGVTVMTDINRYLDFVLKLFFAFGIAFEIPIATVLLIWTGATTTAAMASKRAYVIVGCFVTGMILTPPDIISQILLALPMWLLFETGILFARIFKLDKSNSLADDSAEANE